MSPLAGALAGGRVRGGRGIVPRAGDPREACRACIWPREEFNCFALPCLVVLSGGEKALMPCELPCKRFSALGTCASHAGQPMHAALHAFSPEKSSSALLLALRRLEESSVVCFALCCFQGGKKASGPSALAVKELSLAGEMLWLPRKDFGFVDSPGQLFFGLCLLLQRHELLLWFSAFRALKQQQT